MILIFSSLGARRMYPDQEMMEKTFGGFINSLRRQTDSNFKLFLSYHDRPKAKADDRFIEWCSMAQESDAKTAFTRIPLKRPSAVDEDIFYQFVLYEGGEDDLSQKLENSVIEAVRWAYKQGLMDFWLLRMDSDDLLARNTIEKIHGLEKNGARSVYNMTCHMFDPKKKEVAIHRYPYSTTCHALKFKIGDDKKLSPDWFYMNYDHSLFKSRTAKDFIPSHNLDFAYCILTNTGNNLSGRLPVNKERFTQKIGITDELVDRYGLDLLMGA
jgi:hypothetical protein